MKRTRKSEARLAVCIKNRGYGASLEMGKLYRIIRDRDAEAHGYLRVIDESGEDYGYAADRFFAINLPNPLKEFFSRWRPDARSPNHPQERTVGSHSLAAAAQLGRGTERTLMYQLRLHDREPGHSRVRRQVHHHASKAPILQQVVA